jgi:hypothetical protein
MARQSEGPLTLRSRVYALLFGALAPMLLVAVAFGAYLVQEKREAARQETIGRVLSMMGAIDAALAGSEAALRTLAFSSALAHDDLKTFHAESRRFLATQPHLSNISLASVEGENLTEAVWPYGTRARVYTDLASFYTAAQKGITTYGNVAVGPAIGTSAVRVRVPVVSDGVVHYVVSAPHKLEWFEGLLRAQQPPEDWLVALIDGNRQFIARVPAATPSSTSVQAALQGVVAGAFVAGTLDGAAIYATAASSPRSGWSLAVAIPQRAIDGPASRLLIVVIACTAVALVLAVVLALKLAGRLEAGYRRAS